MPDTDRTPTEVGMPEPTVGDLIRLRPKWDTLVVVATGEWTRRVVSDWEPMPFLPGHKVRCRHEIGLNTRDTAGEVIGVRDTAQGVTLVSVRWDRNGVQDTYTAEELKFEPLLSADLGGAAR